MRRQITPILCFISMLLVFSGNVLGQDRLTPRIGGNVVGTNFVTQNVGELTLEVTAEGTNAGIASFCAGQLDMVVTNRPISIEEEAQCKEQSINFAESRIGYVGVLPIIHPENDKVDCLSEIELDSLLAPSQTGTPPLWNNFSETDDTSSEEEQPISLYLPAARTITYQLLDDVVGGLGLRTDVLATEDVVGIVANDVNALGFIPLSTQGLDAVKVLGILATSGSNCVGATGETLFENTYPLAIPLYAYTAQTEVATSILEALLTSFADDDQAVLESDVLKATAQDIELVTSIVNGEADGRIFSDEVSAYQVSPTVAGTVTLGGSANLASVINTLNTNLSQTYPSLVINTAFNGLGVAEEQLCSGEIQVAVTSNGISETLQQNCEAVDVELLDIEIGTQAVVLVGNAQDEALQCLTTEQLQLAWGAQTEPIETWNQVSTDFQEKPITLFTDNYGSIHSTLLMLTLGAGNTPLRADLETGKDSLYRAAAVANVEGAIALVSWEQYQDIVENQQTNIQLVAVKNGDDCVLPSLETIQNGTYPLHRNTHLVINRNALREEALRAYLWLFFADERATALSRQSFVQTDTAGMKDSREMLQPIFDEMMTVVTEPTPEPTSETPEATPTVSTN